MKKFTFLFVAIFMCNMLFGQIKVTNLGKLRIGTPHQTSVPHDGDNILSASIFGPNAISSASKLSFGDFGRFAGGSANVFIGEYGTTDTDQLWLHGKYGTYLTRGSSTVDVVAYCGAIGSDAFYFNTKVYSKGVLLNSDARFKTNVKKIQTPLSKLMALNGVSYDFSDKLRQNDLLEKHNRNNVMEGETHIDESELTEKEKAYLDYEAFVNQSESKEHKLGFIAQDLQKVFPDLVTEDDLGYLAIDYIGIIPVIVEAVKEQQQLIENLQQEIEVLRETLNSCCEISPSKSVKIDDVNTTEQKSSIHNSEKIILYQNAPNPFNQVTNIQCYIPQTVQKAELCVYNTQGVQVKCLTVSERGMVNVQIQAGQLTAGVYTYLLIGNGKTSDAKQMILTK